ncbi:MAG: hypothetical protein V1904_11485, partial [Bacteroidota bacterium]
MKKVLLIALGLSFGLTLSAQKNLPVIPAKLAKQSAIAKKITINDQQVSFTNQTSTEENYLLSLSNDQLGTTEYDLQTNKCIQNRVVKHPDGTISAAWTMGTGTFADRGTGYNYYNGTAWDIFPVARIEPVRQGWPSMTVANGNEVVITHHGAGLTLTTRTLGTGAWTSAAIPFTAANNLTWPRAMGPSLTSGTIHLIATNYLGSVNYGMVYSRSLDGGATWDIQDSVLPGVDPVTEMFPAGGDSYSMDVNGDMVGIVTGDMTTDVVLIKSLDGGDTWAKQIVWQHQIPMWNTTIVGPAGSSDADGDGDADTLVCTDGRFAVTIDDNGVFHVFMSITRILRDSTTQADYFSFWPYTDGIVYWNSSEAGPIVPGITFDADILLYDRMV